MSRDTNKHRGPPQQSALRSPSNRPPQASSAGICSAKSLPPPKGSQAAYSMPPTPPQGPQDQGWSEGHANDMQQLCPHLRATRVEGIAGALGTQGPQPLAWRLGSLAAPQVRPPTNHTLYSSRPSRQHSHFTDGETKAQGAQQTCLWKRPHDRALKSSSKPALGMLLRRHTA